MVVVITVIVVTGQTHPVIFDCGRVSYNSSKTHQESEKITSSPITILYL